MLDTLCARDTLRMCTGYLCDVVNDIYIVVYDLRRIFLLHRNGRRLTHDILEVALVNHLKLAAILLLIIVLSVWSLAISWGGWFGAYWVRRFFCFVNFLVGW